MYLELVTQEKVDFHVASLFPDACFNTFQSVSNTLFFFANVLKCLKFNGMENSLCNPRMPDNGT